VHVARAMVLDQFNWHLTKLLFALLFLPALFTCVDHFSFCLLLSLPTFSQRSASRGGRVTP